MKTIYLTDPTVKEVVEAAKKAAMEDKIYDGFEIVNKHNNEFLMSINAFDNIGDFADTDITEAWAKSCEDYHIWDEFESKYGSDTDEDEEY